MKWPAAWIAIGCAALATASEPMDLEIQGEPDAHFLTWTTRPDFNYQVEASPDLETWMSTGIAEPGTGGDITYGFSSNAAQWFYRIRETEDPYHGSFLVLPVHESILDLVDGVRFSFDLHVLPEIPDRIRIYQREHDSGDPWEQIGRIDQFAERMGVKHVRGSVVWIPPAEGEYEVLAVAIDGNDVAVASAERRVLVGSNQPPLIEITHGPASPSATAVDGIFTTVVSDAVVRVEFFNNGVAIGTDYEAPFGDRIVDYEGLAEYEILRGTHQITAKAYDATGTVGETAQPFEVIVTGGNARPVLTLIQPQGSLVVQQGQNIAVSYSVSDPDGVGDIKWVEAHIPTEKKYVTEQFDPLGGLTIDTTGWTPGSHRVFVRASDFSNAKSDVQSFMLHVQSSAGATFAEHLAANLADGLTVVPSGAVFSGPEASSGEFTDGFASGLQMDEGILLTTGIFAFWNGGNIAINRGHDWEWPGDELLRDRLAAGDESYTTHDAAALEFDLFCQNGQLEFEFQFGSEEYIEFINSFNDGFLVTVDGVIVSLTPDGEDIVSVNAIHPYVEWQDTRYSFVDIDEMREHLYLSNDNDIAPQLDPTDLHRLVEYNGMTVKLRGHVMLEPGMTRRVRIAIVDALDGEYDSAVFLERNSLRSVVVEP